MEFEVRDLSEPLRQGDIIRWLNPQDSWCQFAIVVTADCDIVHNKHRGVISYNPVLRLRDYLAQFWINDQIKKQTNQLTTSIRTELTRAAQQVDRNFEGLSDNVVVESWLRRRGPMGVLDDLGLDPVHNADLRSKLELLELGSNAAASGDVEIALAAAVRLKGGKKDLTPGELASGRDQLWDKFIGTLGKLPGDLFFLNALGPDYTEGYLVYLRRIREVDAAQIAVDPIQEREPGASGVRMSALASPYKYRLIQKMTAVFADIGLPRDYPEKCTTTVRATTNQIVIN